MSEHVTLPKPPEAPLVRLPPKPPPVVAGVATVPPRSSKRSSSNDFVSYSGRAEIDWNKSLFSLRGCHRVWRVPFLSPPPRAPNPELCVLPNAPVLLPKPELTKDPVLPTPKALPLLPKAPVPELPKPPVEVVPKLPVLAPELPPNPPPPNALVPDCPKPPPIVCQPCRCRVNSTIPSGKRTD